MKHLLLFGLICLLFVGSAVAEDHSNTLIMPREQYQDKMQGAWLGQMIGVCWGLPYEFKAAGKPILDEELEPYTPEKLACALEQDDLYVEMTWMQALEKHGLGVSATQAGMLFSQTEYPLWYANKAARDLIKDGIMPPWSGHPQYSRFHACIDFQIQSDLLGILCPGMPDAAVQLCETFGQITNSGDGIYGGMFVASMYAAAYHLDDVAEIINAGLQAIPAESGYATCLGDVLAWYEQTPDDWLTVWEKIEEKWNDGTDCRPDIPLNVSARLNGAYVALALLVGQGDLEKTMEIAIRCGQDSDCNASSAVGVLGTIYGRSYLEPRWGQHLNEIADELFLHTDYSYNRLVELCQQKTEKIILQQGGQVTPEAYIIPMANH